MCPNKVFATGGVKSVGHTENLLWDIQNRVIRIAIYMVVGAKLMYLLEVFAYYCTDRLSQYASLDRC